MNLMQNSYRDNRDIELHYRDIRIFIIAQPYKQLILPILDYCSSIWDPYQHKLIYKLEMI